MDGLKYIGDGAFIPGVPARDLSAQEVSELAQAGFTAKVLIGSGLYKSTTKDTKETKSE